MKQMANERGNNTPLTVTQAAHILNVSNDEVRKLCDNGTLSYQRTPGGHRRPYLGSVQDEADRRRAENAN